MSTRCRGLSTAALMALGALFLPCAQAANARTLDPPSYWGLPELRLEEKPDFLPSASTPTLMAEQRAELRSLEARPQEWRLGSADTDWLASRFLPERPLSPALIRAEGGRGDIRQLGRALLHDLARPYVNDGREALSEAFRNSPLTTGVALSGAMALGVGAYVGLTNLQNGVLAGQQTFHAGSVRVGLSGEYDLRNGAWAGGVRFDLAGLFSKHERVPIPASGALPEVEEEEPRGLRLLARWLAGAPDSETAEPAGSEDGG